MCGLRAARAGQAVLDIEPELPWPADLYTEGGDQHRGWFHSSLLCAVGYAGCCALPHGRDMRMDAGRAGAGVSKSLGNGVDPVEIADRLGAEIVRLWVAAVDFREDVAAVRT